MKDRPALFQHPKNTSKLIDGMMDTHAHTHTYIEHSSGKTHRIHKSMMTKKDYKTSKPQSISKGAF